MPNLPRFTPKVLSIFITGVLLSACQSTPMTQADTTAPKNVTRLNQALLPSASAQHDLMAALREHMSNERYAVSTYHYVAKPLLVSEIDKNSDTLATTMLKVMDYKDKANHATSSPSFRSLTEYLGENEEFGEFSYLRYDDEVNRVVPDTVTRKIGMSESYQETSDEIANLANSFDQLFYEWNSVLISGDFIQKNGRFDQKAFQKHINDTYLPLQARVHDLLKNAQGYQSHDLYALESCTTNHKDGFLNATKHIKNAQDVQEVSANTFVLTQYSPTCATMISYRRMLEPYVYINQEISEAYLKESLALNECFTQFYDKNNALIEAGKNHHQNVEDFTKNYEDYYDCQYEQIMTSMEGDYAEAYDEVYSGKMGFIRAYIDMKKEEMKTGKTEVTGDEYGRMSFLDDILGLKRTPEQIVAQNLYQYEHLSISGLSHHDPQAKRSQVLWSIDYDSPTATYSMQLPVRADYAKGELTADVSAVLPVAALISPKHAPLPKEVPDGLMSFALPEKLKEQIPPEVIYQAIHEGIIKGVEGIHSEKFTPMDISQDAFAKEVEASRVIKVEFGMKEMGKAYATIAKYVGRDLKAYVDKYPERYLDTDVDNVDITDEAHSTGGDNSKVKTLIDNFTMINTSYHTDDAGGLMSAIEGLLPFKFNMTSYVYLNHEGKIIATQNLSGMDQQLANTTIQGLNQVRYDKALFDKHALASQFKETFAKTAQVDGVALFKKASKQADLEADARYARYDYDIVYDSYYDAEAVVEAAEAAAEAVAAATEAAQ